MALELEESWDELPLVLAFLAALRSLLVFDFMPLPPPIVKSLMQIRPASQGKINGTWDGDVFEKERTPGSGSRLTTW